MARRTKVQHTAAANWLPGFEPEGFASPGLSILQALTPIMPALPSIPREVATVTAMVAFELMTQAASEAIAHSTRDALSVVSSIDSEQSIHITAASAAMYACAQVAPVEESPAAEELSSWPLFDPRQYEPATGMKARVEANLNAIRLMKELASTAQEPTAEHRHALLRYLGWGGLAKVFEEIEGNTLGAYQVQLKSLISEGEFASARASTTSAFFTDPVVVDAIWNIVRKLGFTGGRIIEPAAGTGMFLAGMPADIARRSNITAVEIDKLTGQILQTVFGGLGVTTHISGIEKANVPHGFYDLAISNVPFGDHRTLETRKVGYADWTVHNYFFGKAVDLVRPGGLIVLVTSAGTMESDTSAHRKWLNAHAEMLGAIRLPRNAFKKQAGTEVVADIIVLKKRAAPVFTDVASWLGRKNAPKSMLADGQDVQFWSSRSHTYVEYGREMNGWYVDHPGMVIGQLHLEKGQYGERKLIPVFSGSADEFAESLAHAVAAMPADIYEEEPNECSIDDTSLIQKRITATEAIKPGAFVVHNGKICISEGLTWMDVDAAYKGAARERVLGLVKVRDAARKLIDHQVTSSDQVQFASLQYALNVQYDAFVSKYGNVRDRANLRVFRTDPECPLVLSLEVFDEENERFLKADIFSKRTAGRKEPPPTADNARDAMLISLALHGRINLADMAMRRRTPRSEVERELRDQALAYVDPKDRAWKPAEEYLSGHIRNKIAVAKAAGKRYEMNVQALTSVLPKDLGPGEVDVRLAAPWVPQAVIAQFVSELIDAEAGKLTVSYDAQSATWAVKASGYDSRYIGNRMLNTATWGTSDRSAIELVEAALNQQPPKITRTVDDRTVVDRPATLAAREKYEAVKAEFKKWAYQDEARRDSLLRIYNDAFNQIVQRRYDGSHLVLYGMSNVITPYKHQLNAIWRIMSGGNTLLAHVVGAGKTFTMVAAAMEMRRIGKAHKPCIAVPNHLLHDFTADCVRFYPNAKVLMATKEDLTGDKRREFCARIATGNWDIVVMTHSTFERLPVKPECQNRFLDQVLGQARLALQSAKDDNARKTVKQLEKLLKSLEAKLERAVKSSGKDNLVYFDELGIDFIAFDEAHLAKNLMRVSKMPNIAGLPNVSSNRAFDLWVKTSMIMEARGHAENGMVLATATPIANSVAEIHTMMKFLTPYTLKSMGLYEFDAWAGTFGESVQGMEVSPDGGGYRLNTRFARFTNVADLMSIFKLSADIQTRSMLNLPTPSVKGGKPRAIHSPANPDLKAYTATLVERAHAIRNGSVKPSEDNMLAVANCGRKAALDMRLIDPSLPFDPNCKVAKIRDEVVRIWNETTLLKGTQIIFCDLSTPTSSGFSVYNDLKARLIEAGIPQAEIAFIHDHDSDSAKARLFRMVRSGIVRVLMGSTLKLGMGTNVQKRLKAIHQADAPWRPADVEQRDGRAWRAGNDWDEIELIRYVTEGSFDAYVWNLLEVKAKFVAQLFNSTSGLRTVEDLTMGALTYAEIKAIASGNPLVLEKAMVDAEVMKYAILKNQWEQDRWKWSNDRRYNDGVIQQISRNIAGVEADTHAIEAERQRGWSFKSVGPLCELARDNCGIEAQIGAQILQVSRDMAKGFCGEATVGYVGGMRVVLSRFDGLDVVLESQAGPARYKIARTGVPITSLVDSGRLVLESLEDLLGEPSRQNRLAQRLMGENRDIESRLKMDFEHLEASENVLRRQREIESALDLDKDQAGTEAQIPATETAVPVDQEESEPA